eukprot:10207456-Alexandrium_andersonii.AAC.1
MHHRFRQPQSWSPKLPRGAFCAAFRADPESADGSGPRGVRGHEIWSQAPIRNPPLRNPRNPWL